MKKHQAPKFTLVRSGTRVGATARRGAPPRAKPAMPSRAGSLAGKTTKRLVTSAKRTMETAFDQAARVPIARTELVSVKASHAVKVGIVDLGAWIAELPQLLERLNTCQARFRFYEIQAPVPSGMLKHARWFTATGLLAEKDVRGMEPQVYANEFFTAGRDLREHFAIDIVAGITPAYVSLQDPEGISWNLFAAGHQRELLISTKDLRDFAKQARKPFEAFVGFLLVGQVLAAMNKMQYHQPDRGCLFDYKASRVSIIKAVRKPMIEASCMDQIRPEYKRPAQAFMNVLAAWR